jgi:hypothetical protein
VTAARRNATGHAEAAETLARDLVAARSAVAPPSTPPRRDRYVEPASPQAPPEFERVGHIVGTQYCKHFHTDDNVRQFDLRLRPGSWIAFWEAVQQRKKPLVCPMYHWSNDERCPVPCRNPFPTMHGAHVKFDKRAWIVPACRSCNISGNGRAMYILKADNLRVGPLQCYNDADPREHSWVDGVALRETFTFEAHQPT